MTLSILMSTHEVYQKMLDGQIQSINHILEMMDDFEHEVVLDNDYINQVYEELYSKRRDMEYRIFSKSLDRTTRGNKCLYTKQGSYEELRIRLKELEQLEATGLKSILYGKMVFYRNQYQLGIGKGESMRWISTEDDYYQVMTLFGDGMDDLQVFTEYIETLFRNLVFDKEVGASMKKLEAGFVNRRHEILYHLYCINKEIPDIIKTYGLSDNKTMGENLSIPCSPERKRDIVEKKLTKQADGGEKIKCELHTKMQKLGSKAPDRIYFCASVPKGIVIDGKNVENKIYIYKITEHA